MAASIAGCRGTNCASSGTYTALRRVSAASSPAHYRFTNPRGRAFLLTRAFAVLVPKFLNFSELMGDFFPHTGHSAPFFFCTRIASPKRVLARLCSLPLRVFDFLLHGQPRIGFDRC